MGTSEVIEMSSLWNSGTLGDTGNYSLIILEKQGTVGSSSFFNVRIFLSQEYQTLQRINR